jgi:murein DD-endopeptidase MepM/ murein hydrolase activator NlpD
MGGKIFIAVLLCSFAAFATFGQVVEIPRDESARSAQISSEQHEEEEGLTGQTTPAQPGNAPNAIKQTASGLPTKPAVAQAQPASARPTIEQMRRAGALAAQRVRNETPEVQSHATAAPTSQTSKIEVLAARPLDHPAREPEPMFAHLPGPRSELAFIKLADGFDFPVGKPDANGYYKARGFRPNGHVGEDWDGVGGGDTDLGDPIYCIGDGVVVFARDCHLGWGNVVIVRHAYREAGFTRNIDSLYAHLQKILVRRGQPVKRGQEIATLGNAHGLYDAHLHFEIRKNIEIGMSRAKFAQNLSNYFDPSQFILSHRHLQGGGRSYRIALNTFTHDARIRWDKLPNYSHAHTGGGSTESAAALKKALATRNTVAQ